MSSDRLRRRLTDIVDNADRIEAYLGNLSWSEFEADEMRGDAVERCLQRVTEAVIQIGEQDAALLFPDAQWVALRNLGNRLRHDYERIRRNVIYDIAKMDVAPLAAAAAKALED